MDTKLKYTSLPPANKNCFSLFPDQWSSKVPNIDGLGLATLFEDPRITWLLDTFGSVKSKRVLELGPLEGGHTYMLEKAGANVTAIESSHAAFMKCLIVKNYLSLHARYILGDFTKYDADIYYDLIVASGVLYHMTDPISLLIKMSGMSVSIYIWTHYYDDNLECWNHALREKITNKWLVGESKEITFAGMPIKLVPQLYNEALDWSGFCGGSDDFSYWMYKEDILNLLHRLGYTTIQTCFDLMDHPNGPSIALLAQK